MDYNTLEENVALKIPFDTEAMVKLPLLNQEEQKLTAGSYQFTYPLEDYCTEYSPVAGGF